MSVLMRLFCSSVPTCARRFLHACCLLKEEQHRIHSQFRRRLAYSAVTLPVSRAAVHAWSRRAL